MSCALDNEYPAHENTKNGKKKGVVGKHCMEETALRPKTVFRKPGIFNRARRFNGRHTFTDCSSFLSYSSYPGIFIYSLSNNNDSQTWSSGEVIFWKIT